MILPISIRPANERDLEFIVHSWCLQKARCQPWCAADRFLFERDEHPRIEARARSNASLVAYWDEHPDEWVAWISYRSGSVGRFVLDFAYTKSDHRRQGAFNRLIKTANVSELPLVATHVPRNACIVEAWSSWIVFDPWYDVRDITAHYDSIQTQKQDQRT